MKTTDSLFHYASILLIIALNMLAYLLCILPMESFLEAVSSKILLQNTVHITLHSLFFPALYLWLTYQFKTTLLSNLFALVFYATLLTNSVYYSYFQSPFHLELISQAAVLPDIGGQILIQLISWREIIITLCFCVTIYLGVRVKKTNTRSSPTASTKVKWALLATLTLLVLKSTAMSLRHSPLSVRKHDTLQLTKQFGFLGFYGTEIIQMLKPLAPLPPFPGKINPAPNLPQLPLNYSGKNIIFLQVESLDAQALTIEINGQPLLPHLRKLATESLYFPHFFAQHRGGASQDAELSTLFSVLPVNGRSGFNSIRIDEADHLATVLKSKNYFLAGFHANSGSFFNRKHLLTKIGFDTFKEEKDYTGEASGWKSKDLAFFEQTLPMLAELPQPFFAYLITMQSHGPFKNHSQASASLDLTHYSSYQQDYLRSMHEVDHAIGDFVEKLRAADLLQNTLLFIYADHSSNIDYPAPQYPHSKLDLPEHIPLFIIVPDMPSQTISKVGSHLDLAPTLLHLMQIPETQNWLGSSLLTNTPGKTILNYPTPIILKNDRQTLKYVSETAFAQKYIEWAEVLQTR